MAIQSNQATSSAGVGNLACAFNSPTTVGTTIYASCDVDNFAQTQPLTCTDTAGNFSNTPPTKVVANTDGLGATAEWVAFNGKGGANTVTITANSPSNSSPFIVMIAEENAATGVRVANGAAADFSGTTAVTSLAATVASDICVQFAVADGTPAAAPSNGTFGSNAGALQQTFATQGAGLQDGTSSGGTVNASMPLNGTGVFGYRTVALALIPGSSSAAPNDPIFFGCDF